MQLTEDTAARMRAGDRRDPRSSIFGGGEVPVDAVARDAPAHPEPDRTWFAVAAYNVGLGHLEDARVLAQQAGRNPDRWEDVREFLPLLSQERWYTRTKRGYARGWEPVRYVDNVQAYLNILQVAGTSMNTGDRAAGTRDGSQTARADASPPADCDARRRNCAATIRTRRRARPRRRRAGG